MLYKLEMRIIHTARSRTAQLSLNCPKGAKNFLPSSGREYKHMTIFKFKHTTQPDEIGRDQTVEMSLANDYTQEYNQIMTHTDNNN